MRAAGAGVVLLLVVAGVPWVLLQVAHPGALLDADWATSLLVALDSRLLIGLLSMAGWVAWGALSLTIVLEVVAVLTRHRVTMTLPGTGWLRPLVGALVVAAVAAPTVAAADSGAVASAPPATGTTFGLSAAASFAQQQAQVADSAHTYVVQAGDELWSVAESQLGSGDRWREIVALNPVLAESPRLEPGAVLALPDVAAQQAVVVVQPGDSLWSIAGRELGDPQRWPEVHQLNEDRITDPDLIEAGWTLEVPASPSAPEAVVPEAVVPAAVELRHPSGHLLAEPVSVPALPAVAVGLEPPAAADASEPGVEGPASEADVQEADDGVAGLLGPMSAVLAGGLVAGLASRRRLQVLGRALGRRVVPVAPSLARFWTALARHAEEPLGAGCGPTTIVLGWTDDDAAVPLDVERARAVAFTGQEAEAAVAAALTGLTCAPWSSDTLLVVVGGQDWADAVDDPRITALPRIEEGIAHLTRICSERRLSMGGRALPELRADPDLGALWEPLVVTFTSPLGPAHWDAISDALALGEVGVSVIGRAGAAPHVHAATVSVDAQTGRWAGHTFTPQLITQPARRALIDLFEATGTQETEPAPWWRTDEELPANVRPLHHPSGPIEEPPMTGRFAEPEHPTLLLLGDVELVGAAGTRPGRATGQCLEYCAWLVEHPGFTPTAMTRALMIAETTRRSNVSRLRSWLGTAPDGLRYLPDAYSGRVSLDPRVTSDWDQFRAMLSGGVNMSSDAALAAALRMVRGEPLGSFAFQWVWAEQLKADMVGMIVDAACVLADRSLDRGDAAAALWAVRRGRTAAPADDALAAREILALALAGRSSEAGSAAVTLTRAARAEGRDLAPDLARRVQLALHGSPARRVAGGASSESGRVSS